MYQIHEFLFLAQKGEKDMHEKEKSDWEAEMKKLMVIIKSLTVAQMS